MASRRPCKRAFVEFLDGNEDDAEKAYRFQILLPNGTSTRLILHDPEEEMLINEFVHVIRKEVEKTSKSAHVPRRKIFWDEDIFLEDMCDNKIKKKICFDRFKPNKCHILRLHDGIEESVNTFQNMWDLTPDTDILAELPAEYTFETALADLIDNSLQAVWSNGLGERRLVSVTVDEQKIVIFDSGQGMDGTDENSISKWGKMGSSNHRSSRKVAIGGHAPYLMPFFGMFGYGGPIASMHLGRRAIVSSKTKESMKVYTLHLSREALLSKSTAKCVWRTDGGIRDPLDKEIQISPHGSFTQVEIHNLKMRCMETYKLQCLLKDIYFPYIQCDEEHTSRKTMMPIEFQVNGINLAEINGGQVAVTNLHTCNGPDFVLQLQFLVNQDTATLNSPGPRVCCKANARLKCVYFPIVEGKENFDRILEKLQEDGYRMEETFESFCRVSIRRLGRLLPEARWRVLPFMEPKLKKGDKAQLLRRCCPRVKCFVETDAGFSPTPSKTDLAHHDPFTLALRTFGSSPSGKESEATVEIYKDGKSLSIVHLEKEYQDWIIQMHDRFDEEIDSGEDEPVVVIGPQNKKRLGIFADVVRVHRAIKRKGSLWKSGQKVKILKGAVGCSKNNLYATLELILLEGFQGDVGGEARLICRPLGCSDEKGSSVVVKDGNASLDIHDSLSFPISVIDSGKFVAIDLTTWNYQLDKRNEKAPSTIDVLTREQCRQLEIDGGLPIEVPVDAGHKPPNEIAAVIRPANFSCSSSPKSLDQKYVVKDNLEMSMEVRRRDEGKDYQQDELICAEHVKTSSHHGFNGLYIFSLRRKPKLFCKAGVYMFCFSVICKDSTCTREIRVTVRPASRVGWKFLCDERGPLTDKSSIVSRVGSCISYLSIACFDSYSNQIPFVSLPEAEIKIYKEERIIAHVDKMKMFLSHDRLSLEITDILIESCDLDKFRPKYEAKLKICSLDSEFSAEAPCKVMPGPLSSVKLQYSPELERYLTPGNVIQNFVLEMLDPCGNHIEEGVEVSIEADGLCFQDNVGSIRKVKDQGYVNLSGLLKVVSGYGSTVHLYVSVGQTMIFKKMFQVEKRELRAVSELPTYCAAGTQLENVVFEIVDSDGVTDKAIHGRYHSLTITSESFEMDGTVQYTFQNGRCTVPIIPMPQEHGAFRFLASHTHYPDLQTSIEVFVTQAPKLELVTVADPIADIFQSQIPDSRISLLQDSLQGTLSQMNMLVESIREEAGMLDDKITEVGLRIRDRESKLKILNDQKSEIGKDIYDLQDLIEPEYLSHVDTLVNAKEQIVREIEGKGNTAAAVFCNLSKAVLIQESEKHFMQDIVGIVALLGTIYSSKVSRTLAEYLGEEYMLAIVCKSYEAASAMEKYGVDGKVNRSCDLHEAATTIDMTISGRFPVICLEEIRPYKGELRNNDPQRKLALPNPLLSSGKIPVGFLGYAVNMINVDINHLSIRTTGGYGLRETLFYRLFGEVQVYQTRTDMKRANACIKHGAVSLDGGIMRENGIILLGDCEPGIRFPVVSQVRRGPSRKPTIDILKSLEEKKALLKATEDEIRKEAEAHSKELDKFKKKSARLRKFLQGKSLGTLLDYSPQIRNTR